MKVDIFDKQNNKAGSVDLSDKIFGIKWNSDLVHQALLAQLGNSRQVLAHTKGRSEVRGGGKKPWKQKGTGRARHGSSRSPLWRGGGVTFGPSKERNFTKKINKKMKRTAIFSVLSKKLRDNNLKIVDGFDANINKTKEWEKFLKNIADLRSRILLISGVKNKGIHRVVANLKKVNAISTNSLNVRDLLAPKNIILEKEAIKEIEKIYLKN